MLTRAALGVGLAALLAITPSAHADPRACTVEAIDGTEARGWAAGAWTPLSPGQAVADESKVATGPQTRVKIACDDGIVVTIGTGTEVNLEQLVGAEPGVIVQLIDGIIGLLTPQRRTGGFSVRTPLAIASVRSTEWLVEHGADGSAVFVRAGRVAVDAPAGGRATLDPGEGITITPDGAAGEVKTWGAPRIARSTAALGFDWQ